MFKAGNKAARKSSFFPPWLLRHLLPIGAYLQSLVFALRWTSEVSVDCTVNLLLLVLSWHNHKWSIALANCRYWSNVLENPSLLELTCTRRDLRNYSFPGIQLPVPHSFRRLLLRQGPKRASYYSFQWRLQIGIDPSCPWGEQPSRSVDGGWGRSLIDDLSVKSLRARRTLVS